MKTLIATATLLLSCLTVGLAAPQVFAAEKAQSDTSLTAVKQEFAQTFKAIENYSVTQKDEAIKKTQAALADIDERIDQLENKSSAKWRRMSQATREKEQAVLRELKKERIKVAEWYGSMKSSSAEAWEDTKKGFLKSTDALSEAFTKAENQLLPKQRKK